MSSMINALEKAGVINEKKANNGRSSMNRKRISQERKEREKQKTERLKADADKKAKLKKGQEAIKLAQDKYNDKNKV